METIRRENPRIRIVFARTRQAYGKPHKLPVSQDHPLDPADVNAIHTVAYYRRRTLELSLKREGGYGDGMQRPR